MTRTMPGMPCWSKPSTTMNSLPSAKPWACAHASRNRLFWIDRAGPPLSKESKELENDARPGWKIENLRRENQRLPWRIGSFFQKECCTRHPCRLEGQQPSGQPGRRPDRCTRHRLEGGRAASDGIARFFRPNFLAVVCEFQKESTAGTWQFHLRHPQGGCRFQ